MTRAALVVAAALRDTGEPCTRERWSGVDVLVARPRGEAAGTVVFAGPATPQGIAHPAVARVLGSLAHARYLAIAPELPSVRDGLVTPATVDALVEVACVSGSRVALVGASTGAALAVLAAAELPHVSAVAAIASFAELRSMLRLGTTGTYAGRPYAAAPLVAEMARRSLRASAPADAAVEPLLANRDPDRFDGLYAALEDGTRDVIARLSPLYVAPRIRVPIELACAQFDSFCPADESRALAAAAPDARLTVTRALDHVSPRLRPGLLAVVALVDRVLVRAAAAESASALRPALASSASRAIAHARVP